jgi:hypothetical protein
VSLDLEGDAVLEWKIPAMAPCRRRALLLMIIDQIQSLVVVDSRYLASTRSIVFDVAL